MTTSGTTTFNPTRDQIVYGALRLLGAYTANGNTPRPEQVSDSVEALDMMLKSWQVDGLLHLKTFIYVALVAARATYTIGPDSTDTVTTDAAGAVSFKKRPTSIASPRRRTIATGDEVPMDDPLSRSDYAALPNKATSGTPTKVYYDPQISNGTLYVWPVPSTAVDQIVLTVDRTIEDAGDSDATFDLPPEWVEAVKWNLAARLIPEYPGADADRIEKYAAMFREKMVSFNAESGPTFFQPR